MLKFIRYLSKTIKAFCAYRNPQNGEVKLKFITLATAFCVKCKLDHRVLQ